MHRCATPQVKALLTKHRLRGSGAARAEAERRDTVSHFILRLAYCRSADLRSWYLGQEAALFKARFRQLAPPEQVEFFRAQVRGAARGAAAFGTACHLQEHIQRNTNHSIDKATSFMFWCARPALRGDWRGGV